jgi:GTP-binding protein HflX
VGFIRDLPHDLVASFRSTLEEVRDAKLHIHVLDAADSAFRDQYDVTRQVLADIVDPDHPRLLILNKSDLLDDAERSRLRKEFPQAFLMSAASTIDIRALHGLILTFFESTMSEADFVIPYDKQANVSLLHDRCRVLEERYEEDGAHLRVRAPQAVLSALRREV